MPDEEYITVPQAAELSGLSRRQVRWLLETGVLAGQKPGRDWLVKPSAVMDYLRQERKPGPKTKRREERQ